MTRGKIYEAMFNSARDGVIVSDAQDTIILVNREIERLFGFEKDELIGQTTDVIIPTVPADNQTEHGTGYAATAEALKELWTKRKDGSKLAVEISWSPIQVEGGPLFLAVVRDVTERIIAENKIRESEEQLHSILDNMLEGVQIISFDFTYIYVNDALVKQSGYTRAELLGYTMMEKYPGIENTEMFIRIKESIHTGIGCVVENEFTFPNGSKGYYKLSIQPSSENVFILSQDVSDRKKDEQQIKNQNKLLRAKNKELEQFTYLASHDLQEPLRSLVSLSELLMEEYGNALDANGNASVDFIFKSATRMQELVKGLMEYSRIGRVSAPTDVDCNRLVNEVLADLSLLIKESNAVVTVQNLPVLRGYDIELRILFQNLIDNALKFARKDVVLEIAISALDCEGDWLFSVRDNGIGISEQDRKKIFTIFKRLHNRNDYVGTGIGLSLCKKVVGVHGGAIWVDSKLGEGSTFNFIISENITE